MAVGKSKEDDLDDCYEQLGVAEDADPKEIQSAYRKLSLKCHPDRNQDDPEAPEKFDRLTRAKDLLIDPARRAELDRKRKVASDLVERFAQESGKRKGMRTDLEAREAAAAAGRPRPGEGPSPAELRKRAAQIDYSARLKAKQVEVAEKQSSVVEEVVQTRAAAEESRLRITWRAGGPASSEAVIRRAMAEYDLLSMEISEEGAVVQLASREEAIRAMLECRQRKHQMPFRVALANAKELRSQPRAAEPAKSWKADNVFRAAEPAKKAEPGKAAPAAKAAFADFEAQMFADLQNLAKKQKVAKS